MKKTFLATALLAATTFLATTPSVADTFPDRPVSVMVSYGAGGAGLYVGHHIAALQIEKAIDGKLDLIPTKGGGAAAMKAVIAVEVIDLLADKFARMFENERITAKMAAGGSPMKIMSRDEVKAMWSARKETLSVLLADLK